MTPSRAAPRPPARRGVHVGPVPITPLLVVVLVLFVASPALMLWAIAEVKDERQVTLLEIGSIGMALAFALVALACLRGMWKAAGMARSGRALALAIVGGLAGIGTIGSLTVALIIALVWGS